MTVVQMPTQSRAARLEQIRLLQAEGLTHRQIAERMGIKLSTIRNTINDPDGAKQKARRARYQGTCTECGGPTDGSNGRDDDKRSLRCKWCVMGVAIQDRQRPSQASPRRRVPIRLCDIPPEVRLAAAVAANRSEKDLLTRREILAVALFPSQQTYWIAESALAALDEMFEQAAA